jgi:hypothetical protein
MQKTAYLAIDGLGLRLISDLWEGKDLQNRFLPASALVIGS